jgi:regulator of protease activity HflC (stomatin/prohibitin superfamily)
MTALGTIVVVLAVLALLGLALSVRIVQRYEKGVLFRLGRVSTRWPRPAASTTPSARSWTCRPPIGASS